MMEKRNFVTGSRTPMGGASDIDDIIASAAGTFGKKTAEASDMEKKASDMDEESDREGR